MAILQITLPIFLLIGLGYVVTWRGLFTPEQVRGMGAFVINVALPALIYRLLSHHRLAEVLEWRYFAVYAGASLIMLLGGFLFWRKESCGRPGAAVRAFGMAASNTGFIGLPIATQFLGPHVGVALGITFIVENVLMLPGLIILGHQPDGAAGRAAMARQIARGLARSPLFLSILAAIGSMMLGVQPVEPIAKAIDLLANASAPVALIVIGGSLVRLDARGMGGAVVRIGFAKLIGHPLAVFLLLLAIPITDPDLRHGALLLAAVPMASSYPIFGQRYGEGPLAAATLLVATATSFLTINLLLWLISTGVVR